MKLLPFKQMINRNGQPVNSVGPRKPRTEDGITLDNRVNTHSRVNSRVEVSTVIFFEKVKQFAKRSELVRQCHYRGPCKVLTISIGMRGEMFAVVDDLR